MEVSKYRAFGNLPPPSWSNMWTLLVIIEGLQISQPNIILNYSRDCRPVKFSYFRLCPLRPWTTSVALTGCCQQDLPSLWRKKRTCLKSILLNYTYTNECTYAALASFQHSVVYLLLSCRRSPARSNAHFWRATSLREWQINSFCKKLFGRVKSAQQDVKRIMYSTEAGCWWHDHHRSDIVSCMTICSTSTAIKEILWHTLYHCLGSFTLYNHVLHG